MMVCLCAQGCLHMGVRRCVLVSARACGYGGEGVGVRVGVCVRVCVCGCVCVCRLVDVANADLLVE